MTKQVTLMNTLGGGFGLPTGQIVPGNGSIVVEPEVWNAAKDHPVVKARVDIGTLIVDGKGAKKPAAADGERDENGDTAEMAEMRKRFDASYSAVTSELHAEQAKLAELEKRASDLEARIAAGGHGDVSQPLTAKHAGGGSYSIFRGEPVEVLEKLSKEDAEAFNALDEAGKAKFVADRNKAA